MSALAEAYDDLDRFMVGDEAEMAEAGHVGNLEQVERLLRGVAYRRRKVAQAEALVTSERERLDAYLESVRKRYDTSYHEASLRDYHEARLIDDPKMRTIHLPSGDLVARKQPDRWDIDDEPFLAWAAEHHPDLIRVRPPEVDRSAVKKALTVHDDGRVIDGQSGEVVPAIIVEVGAIGFAVKVAGLT